MMSILMLMQSGLQAFKDLEQAGNISEAQMVEGVFKVPDLQASIA